MPCAIHSSGLFSYPRAHTHTHTHTHTTYSLYRPRRDPANPGPTILLPQFASVQWLTSWYGMGKTSVKSPLNIPGRIAWITMECPGFLTLLYTLRSVAAREGVADLPWQNQVLAALFVIHYSYRAVLYPLLAPSMSPVHALVWAFALAFQLANGVCLGGWLAGYGGGPTTPAAWARQLAPWPAAQFAAGLAVFYAGLAANYYHDDELREIRRREEDRLRRVAREQGKPLGSVEKHYSLPQAGLFRYVLYPHYLVEWIEWTGFYMAAGWTCAPARAFVVNEVFAMLPRTVSGKKWYIERFGEDKVGRRWAVIPGVI
ncbi:uncharacterized protein E0L32_003219 [Thyridium curvatum]|uniref:3-oxo-5-alpha-steroid 4-dehydrogenase C-terminal domain-containing protein n=1 Tax=Thyridium curvatum TaxID=1093900 RepID=A0A507BJ74_9PEZI|nr:uncharacterized protein E0L32_003219 [Thyridium curvatum]TPX17101.1 hypothetical protein E0L32_003219 [Thyridium curvatum]